MKRRTVLPLLAGSLAASCGKNSESKPLVVGMELTYPPFETTDAKGNPDGIGVRLAEALARHLGRHLQIENVRWEVIIASLQTGKVDLIISSLSKTPEREESIDFSDSYVTNGLCALVVKDSPLRKPEDFQNSKLRLAVKAGTTGETFSESAFPQSERIRLGEASDCVLHVIQGKADAFIYDQISIYQSWLAHKSNTRPILEPFRAENWAIGMRKGEALKGEINAFLAKFRAEGGFTRLADQYMKEERKAFEELGVPFIFH